MPTSKTKNRNIKIDNATWANAKIIAALYNITLQELITLLIKNEADKNKL